VASRLTGCAGAARSTAALSADTASVGRVTAAQVSQIVARLQAAYPEVSMCVQTTKLYERLLVDLEFAETDVAVDELIMTSGRLPTIARVRRAVIEPLLDLPTAEEAWVAIQSRAEKLNPLVAKTATLMGGSFNLRTSSDPELSRVRFVKVYDELRRKVVDAAISERARAARMKLAS
jgi:hypothetical protein